MIIRFFKHGFITGCLLFSFSVTDSYARSRYQSDYQNHAYGNYYRPYGSRLSFGYGSRSGYSYGYSNYGNRRGYYSDERRYRRRGNYRRGGYNSGYRNNPRYCPTPRRRY